MGQRDAGREVRFTRLPCEDRDIAIFGISGSLGPAARPLLMRLFQECRQRQLSRVVLDLSAVDSLGGGGARTLNEFAAERAAQGWSTAFRVDSATLRSFLSRDPNLQPPAMAETLEGAMSAVSAFERGPERDVESAASQRAQGASTPERRGDVELDRLLVAIGVGDSKEAEGFSELEVAQAFESSEIEIPKQGWMPVVADDGTLELEELATWWRETLRARGLATHVSVFALQPDGAYHPVTSTGLDLDRGLQYHGQLARRVREQRGPAFLFDLCLDPLDPDEQDIVSALNCAVVVRAENDDHVELLLFLAKERPGDDYTLDELQELEVLLAESRTREVSAVRGRLVPVASETRLPVTRESKVPVTREPMPPITRETKVPVSREPMVPVAGEHGAREPVVPAPIPVAPVRAPRVEIEPEPFASERAARRETRQPPSGNLPQPTSSDNSRLMHGPARILGAPAFQESDRERMLRRKVTQLRDIVGLSRSFEAAFGTSRLIEVLVLSVVSVARTETVLYFGARDGEFYLTNHRGLDRELLPEMALRGDSTLVQATLQTDGPLRIADDAHIAAEEQAWARQHGFTLSIAFRIKERVLGVLLLGASRHGEPDLEMLAHLLDQAALAYDRGLLYETMQDHTLGVVRGLVTLIEKCSGQDAGATERVVRTVQALAQEVQFPENMRRDLTYGAVLRDIGMLRIDPAILRSSGQLTSDQWEIVRRHTIEGAAIMRQMRFGDVAVDIVMHHHEAYNGEGYPSALRGRAIPMGARIVAVAESYVKMTMDRPYRKSLGQVEALESLAENWGLRYDPLIVDALVRVVNRELSLGLDADLDVARDLFGV